MREADPFVRMIGKWLPESPWDQQECALVLAGAQAWAEGTLPIYEFAKIGCLEDKKGLVSPTYTRWVTLVTTDRADPRRRELLRAIEALIRFQGVEITTFGIFDRDELGAAGAVVHPARGSTL